MARPRAPGDPLSWFGAPAKVVMRSAGGLYVHNNESYFKKCLENPTVIGTLADLRVRWGSLCDWARFRHNPLMPGGIIKELHREDEKVTIVGGGDNPCILRGVLVDTEKAADTISSGLFTLHSFDDKPACEHNGISLWFYMGKLHREEGPAMVYPRKNFVAYACMNQLHRLDGPAVVYGEDHHWYKHGLLHREGAPAFMSKSRHMWYTNGTLSLGKCVETPDHIVYKSIENGIFSFKHVRK